jgi:hypothetical protein
MIRLKRENKYIEDYDYKLKFYNHRLGRGGGGGGGGRGEGGLSGYNLRGIIMLKRVNLAAQ